MHLVNGTGNSPSLGRPTPELSNRTSHPETTKRRSDPQRVGMNNGERPMGAANDKTTNHRASCQPPPPPAGQRLGHSEEGHQHADAEKKTRRWCMFHKHLSVVRRYADGPSENSDPTPQAKRSTGDCPGPRDESATQQASPRKRSDARAGRPECGGEWAAKTGKQPRHQPPHPRSANYWAPLTRTRNQREHRPQRPTERSDPTQHAKGRTGDCPGPRKETATRRNVTQGGGRGDPPFSSPPFARCSRTRRRRSRSMGGGRGGGEGDGGG